MLFKETSVYSENNTKHTNALWGQNAELLKVKAGGTYNYHSAFKYFNLYFPATKLSCP
jgi:hypothetical protein